MQNDATVLAKLIPLAFRDAFSEPAQLLTAYFQESTVGLGILDTQFRYLAVNPALSEMNGFPAGAHLGKTCREILGDFAGQIEPLFKEILRTGQPIVGLELSGILPTRSEIGYWLENYFPIKDQNGRVKQIGVLLIEITERKRMEQELEAMAARLQLETGRLQALRDLDQMLLSQKSVRQLFPAISAAIQQVIPHDIARACIYEAKHHHLRLYALEPVDGVKIEPTVEIIPLQPSADQRIFRAGADMVFSYADLLRYPLPIVEEALEKGIRSAACVALMTPKGPLGLLAVASRADDAFSTDDLALLKQVGSALAVWIENAITQEALEKEKERLRVLHEIDTTLASKHDLQQLFPAIIGCIEKVIPYDLAGTWIYDQAESSMRTGTVDSKVGNIFTEGDVTPVAECAVAQIMFTGRPDTLDYGALTALPFASVKKLLASGIRSVCCIPLISPKGTLGALGLGSRRDKSFSNEDVALLNHVANSIALALENALMHRALQTEKERLQVLREIDAALVAHLDFDQMLPVVSRSLRCTLPHDHMIVCIYDEKSGGMRNYAATPEIKKNVLPANSIIPPQDSLTAMVFNEGRSRTCNYADLKNVSSPVMARTLAAGIHSACLVPLTTSKGPLGVLTLSSHKDHAFAPDDRQFLEQVGAALAQAVQNALAHKVLQEEKKRLEVLLHVSSTLANNWDIQKAFPAISSYLRRILHQEYAAFHLLDDKSGLLVRQALDFPLNKGCYLPLDVVPADGPMGQVLREMDPVTFSREELNTFHSQNAKGLLAEGIRSLCCIPLLRPKGPIGVFSLGSMRQDAFDQDDERLLTQVAAQLAVALENHHGTLEIEALKDRLSAERKYLEGELGTEPNFQEIIGQSPALRDALRQVETVASSGATVLILGETGTGKELVARAIHRMSSRRERSLIKVNCAAIPTGLLESELFGHEKGAFTGAVSQKIGRMELADHGTLFLDEIGEIPLELQPKLLRVLQDQEFERLGGVRTIKVDVRLVAATNRDLSKRVASGDFRSDLFYRLNVFPIRMPALRERRVDIQPLVHHFVKKYARTMGRHIDSVPEETMETLCNYPWPGNVRELENLIERSVILSDGPRLRVPLSELVPDPERTFASETLESAEREHILRVLRETGGIISGLDGAAHKLGLKRTTLQSKMQRLRITRRDYWNWKPN